MAKAVILTEPQHDGLLWAKQVKEAWRPWNLVDVVVMNGVESVASASLKIEHAARLAGPGGSVWVSVGHGFPLNVTARGKNDEGVFDLAPNGFRVCGNNAFKTELLSGKSQVSVFYDLRPKSTSSVIIKSDKENDEQRLSSSNPAVVSAAKKRLDNFKRFEQLCQSLKASGILGVFLITCRVMQATGFMARTRAKFGVPILGYTRRVAIQIQASKRSRFFLEGDRPGEGTNVPMGEIFAPAFGTRKKDFVFIDGVKKNDLVTG